MDEIISKEKTRIIHPRVVAGVVLFLAALFTFRLLFLSETASANMHTNNVALGNLQVQIIGYGKLESSDVKLLTSRTVATVVDIYHLPGAKLEKDETILNMSNALLDDEYFKSQQKTAQAIAHFKLFELEYQKEMLKELSLLTAYTASLKTFEFKREAYKKIESGGSISGIAIAENEIAIQEKKQLIENQKQTLEKLKQIQTERKNIAHSEVLQAKSLP